MKNYLLSLCCSLVVTNFFALSAQEAVDKKVEEVKDAEIVKPETTNNVNVKTEEKQAEKTPKTVVEEKKLTPEEEITQKNKENFIKIQSLYKQENKKIKEVATKQFKELKERVIVILDKNIEKYTKEVKIDEAQAIDLFKKEFVTLSSYSKVPELNEVCPAAIVNLLKNYERRIDIISEKLAEDIKALNKKYSQVVDARLRAVSAQGDLETAISLKEFKEKLTQEDKEEKIDKNKEERVVTRRPPSGFRTGGLRCYAYMNNCKITKVAELYKRKADNVSLSPKVTIPDACKGKDYFGLQFSGYFYAPKKGTYKFALSSDDGAVLLIGKQEVITNDGTHALYEKSNDIDLQMGWHPITVWYFDYVKDEILSLKVGYEKSTPKEISSKYLAYPIR